MNSQPPQNDPEAIHTDWEATEMRWIVPSELPNYETVPKLAEVYDSAIHGKESNAQMN